MPHYPKILLVEDSSTMRKAYKGFITSRNDGQHGYTVIEATTAEECLAKYREEKPLCVVLDFVLPDANGLYVIKHLKEMDDDPPVVLINAYSSEQLIVDAIHAGAQDYINKDKLSAESLLLAIDNTIERVAMRKQIKKRNAELNNFTRVVSHDIRSPLGTIEGYLSMFMDNYADAEGIDDKARNYLNKSVECCMHIQDMIRDLHAYCLVETNTEQFSDVSVKKCVQAAVDNLGGMIKHHNAKVEIAPISGNIYVIKSLLMQLLMNLVQNAIKYCDKDQPEVTILYAEETDRWVFSVKDNGIGIAQDDWERIFNVFERVDNDDTPGSGLGLSTCQKVVELHNGQIWVESEVGQGTTFYFSIAKNISIEEGLAVAS